jgi:hypothetical protein
MKQKLRTLTLENVGQITKEFSEDVEQIGQSIHGKFGIPLLAALKRDPLPHGPYPELTLFEAANRIMSDLVILHGVAGLLRERVFPFSAYTVEFGNENKNGFDIRGSSETCTLAGEAFNVAPSFFSGKKLSAVKKLREQAADMTYRILLYNADARGEKQSLTVEPGFHYVSVCILSGKLTVKSPAPRSL